MGIQMSENLTKAYGFLKAGKPEQAKQLLQTEAETALDSKDILFALNCCHFMINSLRQIESAEDFFERGEIIINEWKSFENTASRGNMPQPILYSARSGFFTLALENYSKMANEQDPRQRSEICRKVGLCYKKFGEYETSKNCLIEANELFPGSAPILAELADCFALCGEERKAKVLFREAFFLDPQKIDFSFLDSELICCLIRKVSDKGFTGAALQEWVPVYGVLFGIFSVKRELRSQEVGRLKQDIYAKENESKDPSSDSSVLTPRLINLYFWLIDHYVLTGAEQVKINQILLKIKILDPAIYSLFVK
ncbi:MAG: tetratricopeptide repeat protein [Treponema sp.]|nr:tetratricopeptide repeat protein [Treponema sp.]